MFDVSFSELIVIMVVALVVIGPEKLPKVARTLGALTGRIQRYLAQVKEEINREIRFEDLQALQKEIKSGIDHAQMQMQSSMQQIKDVAQSYEEPVVLAEPEVASKKRTRKPRVTAKVKTVELDTPLTKLVKKRIKKIESSSNS